MRHNHDPIPKPHHCPQLGISSPQVPTSSTGWVVFPPLPQVPGGGGVLLLLDHPPLFFSFPLGKRRSQGIWGFSSLFLASFHSWKCPLVAPWTPSLMGGGGDDAGEGSIPPHCCKIQLSTRRNPKGEGGGFLCPGWALDSFQ